MISFDFTIYLLSCIALSLGNQRLLQKTKADEFLNEFTASELNRNGKVYLPSAISVEGNDFQSLWVY